MTDVRRVSKRLTESQMGSDGSETCSANKPIQYDTHIHTHTHVQWSGGATLRKRTPSRRQARPPHPILNGPHAALPFNAGVHAHTSSSTVRICTPRFIQSARSRATPSFTPIDSANSSDSKSLPDTRCRFPASQSGKPLYHVFAPCAETSFGIARRQVHMPWCSMACGAWRLFDVRGSHGRPALINTNTIRLLPSKHVTFHGFPC